MISRSPDDAPGGDTPRKWARLASRRLLTHRLRFDGRPRNSLLYVPRHRLGARQLPLVLVFHGGASTPTAIARTSAMHRIGEREGFFVAYPTGYRGKSGLTWHPSREDEGPQTSDVDFIRALIEDLGHAYPIDPLRIYAAGFSIGGSLAYELACEASDQIAAIGVVGGTMLAPRAAPLRPVPLIHIHGTKDRRVPLRGGRGSATSENNDWPPVRDGIARWCAFNGCGETPEVTRFGLEGVTRYLYRGRRDVELCLVEGGGHTWPGSQKDMTPEALVGPRLPVFSASEAIWRFFAENPRGRRQPPPPGR